RPRSWAGWWRQWHILARSRAPPARLSALLEHGSIEAPRRTIVARAYRNYESKLVLMNSLREQM
ncbi:unnamed protein product, partial [Prorocentrum cordatum]